MPVALNTVSPPDSDSFKPRRLPVSDDIVAPVVVDLFPGIGFGVPALDTHTHSGDNIIVKLIRTPISYGV